MFEMDGEMDKKKKKKQKKKEKLEGMKKEMDIVSVLNSSLTCVNHHVQLQPTIADESHESRSESVTSSVSSCRMTTRLHLKSWK